jgi:hypothetical protein
VILVVAAADLLSVHEPLHALWTRHDTVTLPLFWDANFFFMFVAAMPALMGFTITDQRELTFAVAQVVRDDVVIITEEAATALRTRWEPIFGRVNIGAQIAGVAVGAIIAWQNYKIYVPETTGYWIVHHGAITTTGWIFLYCIFVYCVLIAVYVVRTVATSLFLRALVARAETKLVPFHPDQCGGLRPVGVLGLRDQYLLTIFGINVILVFIVSTKGLGTVPTNLYGVMTFALIAYLVLGPLVFLLPLVPFRKEMMEDKARLMRAVAGRLQLEGSAMLSAIPDHGFTKDDEDAMERLRKMSDLVRDLPVWPFDPRTLRTFGTAYVLPFATSAIAALVEPIKTWLSTLLK